MLTEWCLANPTPLVDEIDSLVGDTLLSVLRQLRAGYEQCPEGFPQSVVLCGVREIVGEIVRGRMDRRAAFVHIATWAEANIEPTDDREPFREMAERDVLGLHEGNYARHRITPAEFDAWRRIWAEGAG